MEKSTNKPIKHTYLIQLIAVGIAYIYMFLESIPMVAYHLQNARYLTTTTGTIQLAIDSVLVLLYFYGATLVYLGFASTKESVISSQTRRAALVFLAFLFVYAIASFYFASFRTDL